MRAPAVTQVVNFGAPEIAKLLSLIQDDSFDRPSDGYSLLPVLGARAESVELWKTIRDDSDVEPRVRSYAQMLLDWYAHDPDWFRFWRRDGVVQRRDNR